MDKALPNQVVKNPQIQQAIHNVNQYLYYHVQENALRKLIHVLIAYPTYIPFQTASPLHDVHQMNDYR